MHGLDLFQWCLSAKFADCSLNTKAQSESTARSGSGLWHSKKPQYRWKAKSAPYRHLLEDILYFSVRYGRKYSTTVLYKTCFISVYQQICSLLRKHVTEYSVSVLMIK